MTIRVLTLTHDFENLIITYPAFEPGPQILAGAFLTAMLIGRLCKIY